MPKLLMIDDEENIIENIQIYFEDKGFKVIGAKSADEAYQRLSECPDMILLDIMMPELDGISFCRTIRKEVLCPILFLSAKTEEFSKLQGLSAGGDDYITKPFSMMELYARVEAHLRREGRPRSHNARVHFASDSKNHEIQDLWIDYGRREVGYGSIPLDFTKKEYLIVELLSSNTGQIFSQERIYENVWGFQAQGDANTSVMEYIKRIRKKLAFHSQQEWIETVWGIGYRWK